MKRSRALFVIFSYGMLGILGCAGDDTSTTSTAPAVNDAELNAAEVEQIAAQLDETYERTAQFLAAQGSLNEFANRVKTSASFVDFMFTEDHLGAVLLVEPASEKSDLGVTSLPPNVEVVEAVASRETRAESFRMVSAAANRFERDEFGALSYDPFTNEYTVWLVPGATVDVHEIDALADATAGGRNLIGASIRIDIEQQGGLFRGGQQANLNGVPYCTTGFGVISGSTGAYTTAGHCGTGTWTINGKSSANVQNRSVGGYQDREMIVASGASWMVRINSSTEVDMEATAYHIYMGGLYCNYGAFSKIQSCGFINAQNVPITENGITVWTSQSSAVCQPGDSGGPVWKPTMASYQPSGTIESGDISLPPVNGNYKCRYMALDDQLSGTGWSLL